MTRVGRARRPQVAAGLAGAAVFVAGTVRQFAAWSRHFAAAPNSLATLETDVFMSAWADPAITFFHGYWRLGPGQALVVQVGRAGRGCATAGSWRKGCASRGCAQHRMSWNGRRGAGWLARGDFRAALESPSCFAASRRPRRPSASTGTSNSTTCEAARSLDSAALNVLAWALQQHAPSAALPCSASSYATAAAPAHDASPAEHEHLPPGGWRAWTMRPTPA